MKNMIGVMVGVGSSLLVSAAAYAADPADIVRSAWSARRAATTVENTVWKMQDYAWSSASCADFAEEVCYAPTDATNTFAQSLKFDDVGNDGVWIHFFDGTTAKGKGLVMRINGADPARSDRNFCRAMSAVDRTRAIRVAPTHQVSVDPAVTVSWAIVMIQTGSSIHAQASYDVVEHPPHRVPQTVAVRIVVAHMPSYIAYVDEQARIIRQIDVLDAQGNVAWVVKNRATKVIGATAWAPSEIMIIDLTERKAVMMQEVFSDFDAWPKHYTSRDLPCGR